MTPEEIQHAIEGLLSVQRDLQEGQLANREAIAQQSTQIENLRITVEGLVQAQRSSESRMERVEDAILGLTRISGIMAQETQQLKRAVDYLMSKDGP